MPGSDHERGLMPMKRWVWAVGGLLLLALGWPLYGELQRIRSVQEDREQFKATQQAVRRGDRSIRRGPAHWSSLSDTARRTLRDVGFVPAGLDASDVTVRLSDLEGNVHRLRDYRGRWVLINFWATWCPPCRMEMPSMQDLWEHFSEEPFVLLAVNLQENPERIRSFARRYGLAFPVLLDETGRVSRRFRVRGVPETWLIDPAGVPRARLQGPHRWNTRTTRTLFRALFEGRRS